MKKLFLPIALLSLAAINAQEAEDEGYSEGNIVNQADEKAQEAYLQAAADQLASSLLASSPELASWYNDASDDEAQTFNDFCLEFAKRNLTVYAQNTPAYTTLFNAFTDLTGLDRWIVNLTFMSNAMAQALATQQAQPAADTTDDSEEIAE